MNPFRGPADYTPADFIDDVEAIGRMLAAGEPARLPEPEPLVVTDETTGETRTVTINTNATSYKIYAYFVDKYGEPGLRRHVVYFGVIRYLRHHRDDLLRVGSLRQEADGLTIEPGFLAALLARPAEAFL